VDEPFPHLAKIVLLGLQDDETVVISGGIEAGNKVLINSGKVEFYGKKRDRLSRLRNKVIAGDS
jgi:hypothetical protein